MCSAQNATVAFTLVALVTIHPVSLAQGALQLSVGIWNFHRVYPVPLLLGFFLFIYFLLYLFLVDICAHLWFPDHSKKDEIKTMGDVKCELQKKVSKTHLKRKFLGQLMNRTPLTFPLRLMMDMFPLLNRKLALVSNFVQETCVFGVTSFVWVLLVTFPLLLQRRVNQKGKGQH